MIADFRLRTDIPKWKGKGKEEENSRRKAMELKRFFMFYVALVGKGTTCQGFDWHGNHMEERIRPSCEDKRMSTLAVASRGLAWK